MYISLRPRYILTFLIMIIATKNSHSNAQNFSNVYVASSTLNDNSSSNLGVSSFANNYKSSSNTPITPKILSTTKQTSYKSTQKKATISKTNYTEYQKHQYSYEHIKLANSLLRENDSKNALMEFQKSASFLPSAYAYYNIGKIYLNQNNLSQAQSNLQKAYSLNPNSTSVLTALGETNLKLNNLPQAHSYLCATRVLLNN